MRKPILFLILAPGLLILGLGAWLFMEHARGKQAWLAWKAQRISQGDRFDSKELAPPEIPDAENFAKAPLIAGAVIGKDIDPRFKALEPPKLDKEWGDWKEGRRIDLEACAAAYKTKDLLKALAPLGATLKELDEASRRPRSRIPVDYTEYEMPSLIGFRSAVRTLRVRALANLAKGNSEAALADVMTCLRIADQLKGEPNLIASLLRNAMLGITLQPIWEGMLDHRWNEQQLEILQNELQRMDVLASIRLGFEGERLHTVTTFTLMAEGQPLPKALEDPEKPAPPKRYSWLAKGWWYRNLLEIDRFNAAAFLDVVHPPSHRVFPEQALDSDKWMERRKLRVDLVMARIAAPALLGQIERAARLQSALDQAAIACALEHHRLARGAYPTTLVELSPTFMAQIPHDIVNGQSLRYARQDEGFRLYSVGWDLKDEGGRLVWNTDSKPSLDPAKGDWPWNGALN